MTLLIADQNVKFARRVGGRGYIMEEGHIRYSGGLDGAVGERGGDPAVSCGLRSLLLRAAAGA